ncbi:hypothetical protein IMZ48_11110 [Candidatus Bathyarchaeota archaeon]|nr:hypothetical protein [Candidatus Bathyarchaeota archaeon]
MDVRAAVLATDDDTSTGRITDDHTTLQFTPRETLHRPGEEGTITVSTSSLMLDESLLPA